MYTNKQNNNSLLLFFSFLIALIFVYHTTGLPGENAFLFTNFIIMLLSWIGIFSGYRPYSLVKIVYVFIFFFFGVIPLNDEAMGNIYWGGSTLQSDSKITVNILIIIGMTFFWIGGIFKLNLIKYVPNSLIVFKRIVPLRFLAIYFGSYIAILFYNDFDLMSILFRGLADDLEHTESAQISSVYYLIYSNFIRSIPVVALIFIKYYYEATGLNFSGKIVITVFFLMTIFIASPTSMPRFQAAALYIPLIIVFTGLWNSRYGMPYTILAGLMIGMPFLNKFRYFDINNIDLSIDFDSLSHGHFDAYQNFVRVVEVDYVSFGSQLLGVFLFFIPREYWSSKPIGSGAEMAQMLGYSFGNISMPYIAEGYVNFGFFGVVVFMCFLGFILKNLDRLAWSYEIKEYKPFFLYYYYSLFGMIFFIMRGDLLSSFAYTVGLTAAFIFLISFCGVGFYSSARKISS